MVRRVVAGLLAFLVLGTLTACGATAGAQAPPGPAIPEPGTPTRLTRADVDSWLDGRIPAALEREGIPGAAVVVVHDGKILTSRGFGWARTGADGEARRRVDPARTLFRVGSVSKIATSTAVMQLVEQGDLDLDTDISGYVDVDIERRFDDDITLRNLLTHTAGFEERSDGTFLPEGAEVNLADNVRHDPPVQVFRPGTTPSYSNYGLTLAGYIVQEVSGEPFEDYVAKHVFAPIGMTSSTFAQPLPRGLADRMATGYLATGTPGRPFEMAGVAPAGAMTSTADDMARFMLAHLGELDGGHPLLASRTRELMQAPALGSSTLGGLAAGQRMALGWFDLSRNGHRVLSHGGDSNLFHALMDIYPDDRTGIFIVMNGTGDTGGANQVRTDLMTGFTDRYFPAGGSAAEAPGATVDTAESRERAARVQGRYETTRSMFSTYATTAALMRPTVGITALAGGRLRVDPDPNTGKPGVFEEVAPWVWQEADGYRRLAVQVEDGKVVRIGHDAAMSMIPVTPVRSALVPAFVLSALVLLAMTAIWATGVIRGYRARRAGVARPKPTRMARLARWGAVSGLLAFAAWVVVSFTIPPGGAPPVAEVRLAQFLQALAVIASVPAAVALVQAVRRRAGARRIIAATVLPLALVAMAWVAWTGLLLTWDISI